MRAFLHGFPDTTRELAQSTARSNYSTNFRVELGRRPARETFKVASERTSPPEAREEQFRKNEAELERDSWLLEVFQGNGAGILVFAVFRRRRCTVGVVQLISRGSEDVFPESLESHVDGRNVEEPCGVDRRIARSRRERQGHPTHDQPVKLLVDRSCSSLESLRKRPLIFPAIRGTPDRRGHDGDPRTDARADLTSQACGVGMSRSGQQVL